MRLFSLRIARKPQYKIIIVLEFLESRKNNGSFKKGKKKASQDPAELQGIQEMPSPQNKQDVKRFLWMVNYLQRYAPSLSQATAPLREKPPPPQLTKSVW